MILRLHLCALSMAFALFAMGAQSQAQTQPPSAPPASALSENAKEILGSYEFSNSDRDRVCRLTLKADPSPHGFKIEFDEKCGAAFPLVGGIASWQLTDNGLLRFLDTAAKPVIEFSEVEGGMYEAPTPGYGVLFLQNAASLAAPAVTNEQMAGEWTLQRGGKALCEVTLSANESGDEGFALRLRPGCDPAVTRFNPVVWRIDRGELVLAAKNGDSWRFEEGENSVWRRIPVRNDGFVLVKK